MANAKYSIEISAIAKDFINSINKSHESIDELLGSVSQVAKEYYVAEKAFKRGEIGLDSLTASSDKFVKACQLQAEAIVATSSNAKEMEKSLSSINTVMKNTFYNVGQTDTFNVIKDMNGKLKDTIGIVKEVENEEKRLNKERLEWANRQKEIAREVNEYIISIQEQRTDESIALLKRESEAQEEVIRKSREKYDAMSKQFANKQVDEKLFEINGDELGKANSTLKEIEEKIRTLYQLDGDRSSAIEKATEQYKAQKSVIEEIKNAQIKAQEDLRNLQQQTQTKNNNTFMQMTGDDIGLQKAQLQEYEVQLRSFISVGEEQSAQARKLAEDYKTLKASMDKASKQTTSFTVRMSNLIKSFVSAQLVVYAIRKVFTDIINTIKEASEAAMKAEETANLFNTTFEKLGSTANSVAIQLSSTLGTATSTMQQALGLFGDLAQGYKQSQSASLDFAEAAVQTTLDLISFKNIGGDVTDTMQKVASGLSGNYENFRKLGIIITKAEIGYRLAAKGLDKLTGSALQYAQVNESLLIVQEKSKNAMGDMLKTIDSTENVIRRVKEANKEFLENMGSGVNNVLNPFRKAWLNIVDALNKANKAKKELESGSQNINVYDLKDNKKDIDTFKDHLALAYGDFVDKVYETEWSLGIEEGVKRELDRLIPEIERVAKLFGATFEDIKKHYPTLFEYDEVKDEIEKMFKGIEKERALEISINTNKSSLDTATNDIINFFDAINETQGFTAMSNLAVSYAENINRIASEYARRGQDISNVLVSLENDMLTQLANGVKQFDLADWTQFGSQVKIDLGLVDELSGLNSKLSETEKLYEELYNKFLLDGEVTQKEQDILTKTLSIYESIGEQVARITAEKERQANLEKAIQGANSSKSGIYDSMAKFGMNDRQSALYDVASQKTQALSLAKTDQEIKNVNKTFEKLVIVTNKYHDMIDEATKKQWRDDFSSSMGSRIGDMGFATATMGMSERDVAGLELLREKIEAIKLNPDEMELIEENFKNLRIATDNYYNKLAETERQANFNNALSGFDDITKGNDYSLATMGMTDLDKAFYDIQQQFENDLQFAETAEEIERLRQSAQGAVDSTWALAKAQDDLAFKQASMSMLGSGVNSIIGLVESFQGKSDVSFETNLMSMLADLVSKTEAFQRLSSIVTDSILPVLDAFLTPLLPMLDIVTFALQSAIMPNLEAAFPFLKVVAATVTGIIGTVTAGFNVIKNSFKWLWDSIDNVFKWLWNKLVGALDKLIPGNQSKWKVDLNEIKNPFEQFGKEMALVGDKVAEIMGATFEIAKNTSKDVDFSVIEEMYNKGLISANEKNALKSNMLGQKWDLVGASEISPDKYITSNAHNTGANVTVGGVTINITANDLDSIDYRIIAREIEKAIANGTMNA